VRANVRDKQITREKSLGYPLLSVFPRMYPVRRWIKRIEALHSQKTVDKVLVLMPGMKGAPLPFHLNSMCSDILGMHKASPFDSQLLAPSVSLSLFPRASQTTRGYSALIAASAAPVSIGPETQGEGMVRQSRVF
jgi:hypothetical protein